VTLDGVIPARMGAEIEGNRIMTMSFQRESAKIYQFPVRGAAQANKRIAQVNTASGLKSIQYAEAAFGGSWYHEAAIRDSQRNPNN
jgi:Protein of unknown function (DUF2735)